jgi:hypothetical protein
MRLYEGGEPAAVSNKSTACFEPRTLCNQHPPALPTQHPAPNPRQKSALCSGKYCGSHQSIHRHFLTRAAHLCELLVTCLVKDLRSILVGLSVGLLLATSDHSPGGTARCRYAMAARQCGSIEGRENPGPQT